jgi:hypothetical protein
MPSTALSLCCTLAVLLPVAEPWKVSALLACQIPTNVPSPTPNPYSSA